MEKSSYGMDWLQKDYDIVPQSWIINNLKMHNISGEVIQFIENVIQNRRVELTTVRKSLTKVKIQWKFFHGDELSLLLF